MRNVGVIAMVPVDVVMGAVQVQQPVTPAQHLLQILPAQWNLVVEHPNEDKDQELGDN